MGTLQQELRGKVTIGFRSPRPPPTAAMSGDGIPGGGGAGVVGISTRQRLDESTCSLAPSHILADGRFVYLPEPTDRERRQFFERTIARHGLLQEDLGQRKEVQEGTGDEEAKADEKKAKEAKVHPLAVASARIHANGINELNRAINLSSLVSMGDYFGMSNIVDPSLEALSPAPGTSSAKEKKESSKTDPAASVTSASGAAPAALAGAKDSEEERIRSLYVLKRKRSQLLQAGTVLGRHKRRLEAAVVAQMQPDRRLRELRRRWRLVAPEHGTRALPHAARPTEVLACDVDVYLDDSAKLGRLTSRVPRYATMELRDTYKAEADLPAWRRKFEKGKDDNMDEEEDESDEGKTEEAAAPVWTVAEPFVIADPTLGKLDTDFDPKKVTIFSLEFEIEKASTGYRQSSVLQPISDDSSSGSSSALPEDEQTLHSLQHSLFCAKLFESIRRELAPDTEEVGTLRTAAAPQSVAWLSHECESNFLPPPSYLSGDRTEEDLDPLAVLHCHEGEVKVQLDAEYALRVKLVEAPDEAALQRLVEATAGSEPAGERSDDADAVDSHDRGASSGSQSPRRLLWLCRTLLYHAEERYHEHSKRQVSAVPSSAADVHVRKPEAPSPRILQSCVSLGSKLLLEHRIRRSLLRLQQWLRTQQPADLVLQVEWLSLSVLDRQSHFALVFGGAGTPWWVADAHVSGCRIALTRTGPGGGDDGGDCYYRKATFRSEAELELHLRLAFQRVMRQRQREQHDP